MSTRQILPKQENAYAWVTSSQQSDHNGPARLNETCARGPCGRFAFMRKSRTLLLFSLYVGDRRGAAVRGIAHQDGTECLLLGRRECTRQQKFAGDAPRDRDPIAI